MFTISKHYLHLQLDEAYLPTWTESWRNSSLVFFRPGSIIADIYMLYPVTTNDTLEHQNAFLAGLQSSQVFNDLGLVDIAVDGKVFDCIYCKTEF